MPNDGHPSLSRTEALERVYLEALSATDAMCAFYPPTAPAQEVAASLQRICELCAAQLPFVRARYIRIERAL